MVKQREETEEIKVCPECGALAENAKFCQHCGEAIDKDCIVCPKCGKATREAFKVENGAKVRVCKKCGETI